MIARCCARAISAVRTVRASNATTREIAAVEEDAEGAHHLTDAIVASPWSDDRLHANSIGHARIAEALAFSLGLPGSDASWTEPLPSRPRATPLDLVRAELAWTRRHLLPFIWRHLRGRSSGDGIRPKRPELTPL